MVVAESSSVKGLEKTDGFTLVDFAIPQRERPVIHPTCDPLACFLHSEAEPVLEDAGFQLTCQSCLDLLAAPTTSIAQIFAILRLWMPEIQENIDLFVDEILKRGANVNDRDGQTDFTLLHYSVRAGVGNIQQQEKAADVAAGLIRSGADVNAICRWTHMSPLHLSAFFDAGLVMKVLLQASGAVDVNLPCLAFEGGTSLHIAASNCSLDAARCLLNHGANVFAKDFQLRLAIDLVPSENSLDGNSHKALIPQMRQLLKEAQSPSPNKNSTDASKASTKNSSLSRQESVEAIHDIQGQVILQSLGLNIGDRVTLGGPKAGILRYCGTTEFADGMWAGIELDRPIGKNNGSVNGISYFTCQANFGIFVPVTKVKVLRSNMGGSRAPSCGTTPRVRSGQATPTEGQTPAILSRRGSFSVTDSARTINRGSRTRSASAGGGRPSLAGTSRPSSVSSTRAQSRDVSRTRNPSNTRDSSQNRDGSRTLVNQYQVGDRVNVAGQRRGTIRFVGETEFAKGLWLGIELDDAVGKNDGSVNGVSYFVCPKNKGVFAPPSRVNRIARSTSRASLSRASSTESLDSVDCGRGATARRTSTGWMRRSFGGTPSAESRPSRDRGSRASCSNSMGGSQTSLSSVGSTRSLSSTISTMSKKEALNRAVKPVEKTKLAKLTTGVNVFYNDQIGVVRYIGNTHFEEGTWVGIELRTPEGKNDGSVSGHRYFTCPKNYGVFVRPSKITVRGINGAKLLAS